MTVKARFRSASRVFALEPRILFDGAAAVAGADALAEHQQSDDATLHEPAAESRPSDDNVATLVVIDARVADHESLLAGLPANVTVRIVDQEESGIDATLQALAQGKNGSAYDAVHIVSHGTPGSLTLGSDIISNATLEGHAQQLQGWGVYLSADADILLYGCDIAANEDGMAFITGLAHLTSADIAASTDATGAAHLGGDWDLTAQIGSIEAGIVFSEAAMAGYGNLLAAGPTVTIENLPQEHLIGETFSFDLKFNNTGSQAGFGPYIDLILPQGADSDDGITLAAAGAIKYLGQDLAYQTITITDGTQDHPYARDTMGQPVKITGTPGDKLIVIELPFGSFTTGQPAISLNVTAQLSDLADVGNGVSLALAARAGFRFGNDALANYAIDPSIVGVASAKTITPIVVEHQHTYDWREGETTSGPNFPRSMTTTITVAPGQTLTDYDVQIALPDNVVFKSVTGGVTQGELPSMATPGTGVILTQRFATLGAGVHTVKVEYWVPEEAAGNNHILNPATGAAVGTDFHVSGEGQWDPKDTRDDLATIRHDPTAVEVNHLIKSIAVQKSVAIGNGSTQAARPGDTLEYTLDFQISDYFSFKDIVIEDTVVDGHQVTGTPVLEIWHQGTKIIDGIGITPSDATNSANDDITRTFDISAALATAGQSVTLAGGRFDGAVLGGTYGRIVYQTTVKDKFESPVGGDANINHGDNLTSTATIRGTLVMADTTENGPVTDSTNTNVPIVSGGLRLEVFRVNDGPVPTSGIRPGDKITYRLVYDLATGDYEKLTLDAYLPLPVLKAADWDDDNNVNNANNANDTWTRIATSDESTAPGLGEWKLVSGDYQGRPNVTTDLASSLSASADPASNRLSFNLGDRTDETNAPTQIVILFSAQVADDPFADALYLTAMAQATEHNTPQTPASHQAIDKIQLNEPELIVKHGIVATSNGTISGTSGTWAAAGDTGLAPFTGTIPSVEGINGNVTDIDAGDRVRFALGIENKGGSGAFDVATTNIALPPGFAFATATDTTTGTASGLEQANLKVYRGDGTLLTKDTDYTVSGGTITLLDTDRDSDGKADAAIGKGRDGASTVSNGSNVIVVTYDAIAVTTIAAGGTQTSDIGVETYASVDNGEDFLPGALKISDDATATVATPKVEIKFKNGSVSDDDSSAGHTTGNNVVIGESMVYDIVVTLPEGTTHDLKVNGLVPAGMKLDTTYNNGAGYELITTKGTAEGQSDALAADFDGTISVGGMAPVSGTLGDAGVDPQFTMRGDANGSVLTVADDGNDASDNSFVIRVRLITANVQGNQGENGGTSLHTDAGLVYDRGGEDTNTSITRTGDRATVVVREPALTITKVVDTDGDGQYGSDEPRLDDNDPLTYKTTITNPTGYDAFDLSFRDPFPVGMLKDFSDLSVKKGETDITSEFEIVGDEASGFILQTKSTADIDLAVGESIVITVKAVTTSSVASVSSFDSNATVQWTSLNGDAADERTGADSTPAALNNYRASDGAPVFTKSNNVLSRVGGLAETVMPADSTEAAGQAIGEIVRFRMVTTVAEGSIGNLSLRPVLPPGYAYMGEATVALVADSAMTSSNGLATMSDADPALHGKIDSGLHSGNEAVRTIGSYPTAPITADTNGGQPIFHLGNITNNDNDPDAEYIVIEFNAIVRNDIANQAGTALSTYFDVYTGGTKLGDSSNTTVDTIVEASVSNVGKTILGLPSISGETATITVQNRFTVDSGANSAPAYEMKLQDQLPGGSVYAFERLTVGSMVYASVGEASADGITVGTSASGITLAFANKLDPGTSVDFQYKVNVPSTAAQDATAATNAELTWSSLPDGGSSGNFQAFGNSSIGNDGSATGERTGENGLQGSNVLNDYKMQTPAGYGIVSGTLWDDTDGDRAIDDGETRLAGVTVTLTWAGPDGDLATPGDNQTLTTTTNASGEYSFGALPTGNYTISVSTTPITRNDTAAPADPFVYAPVWDADEPSQPGTVGTIRVINVTAGTNSQNLNIAYGQRINEAPVIGGLDNTPTFTEGANTADDRNVLGTPVLLDPSVTITDPELTASTPEDNFGGTTLTIGRNNGSDGFTPNTNDVFGIGGGATLSGSDILVSGMNVATLTSNTGGQMVITFLETASSAQVNAVASAITYANSSQTPEASVSIRYRFNDDNQGQAQGKGGSLTGDATITVTIAPTNDLPLAVDDHHQIIKTGTSIDGNTITGAGGPNTQPDSDPEGDALTVTAVRTGTEPDGTGTSGAVGNDLVGTYGTLLLNSDGSYTYTLDPTNPDVQTLPAGSHLKDYFTYTISDGNGETDTAQLTITINGLTPNLVPVANHDRFETKSEQPLSSSLIGNDKMGDGTPGEHVWTKTTDPANGTVTVNPDGTFTYTPNPGFSGEDSFTYTITDKDGDTSTATVTITVDGVPVANNDVHATPPNTPVSGSLGGNDTPSPDGGNVWSKTTDPANGSVTVNPDGTFTYTPNPGFTGEDSFTYTITDKDGDTSTATVTITVNGVPVANDDATSTEPGVPVSGSLTSNDKPSPDGGNVWSKTTDPANGSVTVNPDGSYTYTPNPGFVGEDSFTYTITDKDGDTSTATVTITVGQPGTPGQPGQPGTGQPVDPGQPAGPGQPFDPAAPPSNPQLFDPNPGSNWQQTIEQNDPAGGFYPSSHDPLPQRSAILGDAVRDPSVYFGGERTDEVRRLPLPFHPIVYVNRQVQASQAERAIDDARHFSNPIMVNAGEVQSESIGAGLGMDPNLFVQHAVRDTQHRANFVTRLIDGRLGRTSLSGDNALPTPSLFQPDANQLTPRPTGETRQSAAPAEAAQDAPEQDTAPQVSLAGDDADAAQPLTEAQMQVSQAAPSFGEQLRGGSARLPVTLLAARKTV